MRQSVFLHRAGPAFCLVAGLLFCSGCTRSVSSAPIANKAKSKPVEKLVVQDLAGRDVDPMPKDGDKAVVFIFTRCDCPISNRYAPVIKRLYEQFKPESVDFRLIYPDSDDTAALVREHTAEYKLPGDALMDLKHAWVHHCGVDTTPEAVVFLSDHRTIVYRGRIDNRYVDFGVTRPAPTAHDLQQAIEGALAHRSTALVTTKAIGCPIVD